MTQAQLNIDATPTTLDAALAVIEALRDQASEGATELRDALAGIEDREETIAELEGDLESLEFDERAFDDAVDLLACSVLRIKAGRIDEALADIQIWLNRNDSGRKVQCAAVAVLL